MCSGEDKCLANERSFGSFAGGGGHKIIKLIHHSIQLNIGY